MRGRAVDWFKRWAKGRQGVTSLLLALLIVGSSVSNGTTNAGQVPAALLGAVLVASAVVWLTAQVWEAKGMPATPRFARTQPATGSRQLREDANARIFCNRGGFLFAKRFFFVGTGCPPVRLSPRFTADARSRQEAAPVLVAYTAARRFWWYRDGFVWENQDLQARDVMALLHDRDRRHGRELGRAHVLLDVEQGLSEATPRRRQSIPREVREAVYAHDGGQCVECQSSFDLQYDHIIPWSHGGADTVQNLQLLCAPCNQSKGASF